MKRSTMQRRMPGRQIPPAPARAMGGSGSQGVVAATKCRMPGEFERQEAIVLGCAGVIRNMPQVFVNLVRALMPRVRVVCLVNEADMMLGQVLLSAARLPRNAVEFVRLASISMWARDWCPVAAYGPDGRRRFVAFELRHLRTSANTGAEPELSRLFGAPVVKAPLTLEGGNILSNGDGLCLTSTTVFPKNAGRNMDHAQLGNVLSETLGAKQWAYLDPLSGETTGHIDLFCTFLAKDLVVVGQYEAREDGVNASLLDHAAQVLSTIQTSVGPMRVKRIPMPPPADGRYRSYTNVIMVNGLLLVPLYPQIDEAMDRRALAIYKEMVPDLEVVGIDISEMSTLGGGLHCMSSHVVAGAGGVGPSALGAQTGALLQGRETAGILRA